MSCPCFKQDFKCCVADVVATTPGSSSLTLGGEALTSAPPPPILILYQVVAVKKQPCNSADSKAAEGWCARTGECGNFILLTEEDPPSPRSVSILQKNECIQLPSAKRSTSMCKRRYLCTLQLPNKTLLDHCQSLIAARAPGPFRVSAAEHC